MQVSGSYQTISISDLVKKADVLIQTASNELNVLAGNSCQLAMSGDIGFFCINSFKNHIHRYW